MYFIINGYAKLNLRTVTTEIQMAGNTSNGKEKTKTKSQFYPYVEIQRISVFMFEYEFMSVHACVYVRTAIHEREM